MGEPSTSRKKDAIKELKLNMIGKEEIDAIVEKTIEKNSELIEKRGLKAFGAIMGITMKQVRGRVKAELVTAIIKEKLESYLKKDTFI